VRPKERNEIRLRLLGQKGFNLDFVVREVDRAIRKTKYDMRKQVIQCVTCGDQFGIALGLRARKRYR
jgi:hypothetical protein